MLSVFAFAAVVLSPMPVMPSEPQLALSPLPVMPSDTPPPLPIPVESLSKMKSREDIITASRLANGKPAPATLVLPHLRNRADVLRYMIEHYPPALRGRADFDMPWAWMFVDVAGHTADARIIRSSGRAEFDSLALASLRIARFDPALVAGKAVAVWVPMPVQIAYEDLAAKAQPDNPYTTKPTLLNRSQVSRSLVQNYPPNLRAAGVGGRIMVWVHLNESGEVIRSQVKESSGNVELDRAALVVARIMRFKPARDRDGPREVWIALPIVFQSR